MVKAAFIFLSPEASPVEHRSVLSTPSVELTVVGTRNYSEAEDAVQRLINEGITSIELCAGFGNEGTARIARVAGGKAHVGAVRFDLHPGLDYKSGDNLF